MYTLEIIPNFYLGVKIKYGASKTDQSLPRRKALWVRERRECGKIFQEYYGLFSSCKISYSHTLTFFTKHPILVFKRSLLVRHSFTSVLTTLATVIIVMVLSQGKQTGI